MSNHLCTRLLFALLLFALPAAADIKIAVTADNPPFVFVDGDGEQSGFDVDMVDALCQEIQMKCQLTPLAGGQRLAALKEGTVDAVLALPAADYGENVLLSKRYYKQGARFVRKNGDKTKIAYKRLAGRNVAVVTDTVFDRFLSDKFSGVNVKRYADMPAAYAALAVGDVEYVLGDRIAQFVWAEQQQDFETAGPNYSTAKYFADVVIAVRTPALRDAFNTALAAVRTNGAYKELNKRYFPFDIYGR